MQDSIAVAQIKQGKRQRPHRRAMRNDAIPLLMTLPVVLLVAVVLGFPLLFNVFLSFTNASAFTGLTNITVTGLDNYKSLLTELRFQNAFRLTVLWTVANLALQLLVGLFLALVLHSLPLRVAKVLQPVWLIPWVVPAISIFYVWRLFFNPTIGPIHHLLRDLGLVTGSVLANPDLAIWAAIVAGVWKGFPLYMVVMYSALQAVPQELYDAARVDGANRAHIFWFIELPEIRVVATPAAILGFIWVFNWFTPIFAMTEGGPGGATTTVGIYIYEEALRRFNFGTSAVAATGLIMMAAILFFTAQVLQGGRGRRTRADI